MMEDEGKAVKEVADMPRSDAITLRKIESYTWVGLPAFRHQKETVTVHRHYHVWGYEDATAMGSSLHAGWPRSFLGSGDKPCLEVVHAKQCVKTSSYARWA